MSETAPTPPVVGVPPETKVSPKVALAALLGFLAPALLATIAYLTGPEGQTLFTSLPPVLVVFLLAVLTSLATFLGGYLKRDPLREEGARALYGSTNIERDAARDGL